MPNREGKNYWFSLFENSTYYLWGLWVFLAFLIPFLTFLFLLNSSLVAVFYQNYFVHSILLFLVCILAFSTSYFAYHVFSGNKDFKVLILSLAFYIFGFLFFIHGIAVPGFLLLSEAAFDATEHFSLFLGSIFFLAMFFPLKRYEDFLFRNRLKIFLWLNVILAAFFILFTAFPAFAELIASAIDVLIGFTGILFLAVIFLFADQYQQTKSSFLFSLMLGCAVLINTAIVPFFYHEWNILWWYFHLIFILGFSVILIGLAQGHKSSKEEEKVFTSVPFLLKIATKIRVAAVAGIVSVVAVLFIGYQTATDLIGAFQSVQEESMEMHDLMDISININNAAPLAIYHITSSIEPEKNGNFEDFIAKAEMDFKMLEPLVANDPQDEIRAFYSVKSDYEKLKLKIYEVFAIERPSDMEASEVNKIYRELAELHSEVSASLSKWHAIADQESLKIERQFTNIQWSLVLYGMLLILFLMVYAPVSWLMILNWTVNPLKSLVKTARQIASGDMSARAEVASKDEIGFLAENFNMMTEKLILANQYIKGIINTMPVALIVADKDGNITTVNSLASKMLKYSEKYLLGKSVLNIFMTRYIEAKSSLFERLKMEELEKSGYVNDLRVTFLDSKSEEVPVALSAVLLKKNGGETESMVFIAKDMRELSEHLKSRLAEFVSIASHQLRTPLTSMKLFIEMLVRGDIGVLNDKQKEYMDNIQKSTSRMINLVNDLLSVSRVESGMMSVNPEPTQLEAFIQGLLDELKTYASYKHCKMVFEKPKENLSQISLDVNLMRQIFTNIFSNAIKYSPEDRCEISVKIEQVREDYILVSVADKGIGIPKELQPRVFEKFFRADNALKTDVEGTGLGLYVVKMILGLFGGTIWFESKEDVGTTFYITIPIKGMMKKAGKTMVTNVEKNAL